jgi:hypothetical protein
MPDSPPARYRSLVTVGVPALVVTLGVGGILVSAPRTDGPLAEGSSVAVDFPLRRGQTGTWGTVLPANPTPTSVMIESINAVDPRGLEIVGVLVNDPQRDGGVGTLDVFPPPGSLGRAVEGARVAPSGAEAPYLQVLVGVRLTGAGDGTIEALRVQYRHDGTLYEVVLPHRLRVTSPSP